MSGGDCDHSGTNPLIDNWTSSATAMQTAESAYRTAADGPSVARKPRVSLVTGATPVEDTPATARGVALRPARLLYITPPLPITATAHPPRTWSSPPGCTSHCRPGTR